jgi:glycerol-3-phosphate acyltransferase PlsX
MTTGNSGGHREGARLSSPSAEKDSRVMRIAVDAMSGDHGVRICVPASLALAHEIPALELILVGDSSLLEPMIPAGLRSRVRIQHSSEVVGMDEKPVDALRKKKDSSMRVAIDLVKQGEADACVSAGNTGALMATAKFVLKTLPGIDRPAIMSAVPAIGGHTHMLDLGANAECSAEQLYQFGVMGSVVAADIHGMSAPRVGLLNIGSEELKGNDTVREAHALLKASKLNFVGFVEGNDIFKGTVDVVVTDGFTGNISLKTMEGAAQLISYSMRQEFSRGWLRKLQALVALPALRAMRARMDPRTYNGASLLGLNGIVVKSHGSADELAFQNALRTAVVEVEKGVPQQIRQTMQEE